MKSAFGEPIIKCPVCKKRYSKRAMSNHIIQSGQQEVYQLYRKRGYVALGSNGHPHEDFRKKNQITLKKFSYVGK